MNGPMMLIASPAVFTVGSGPLGPGAGKEFALVSVALVNGSGRVVPYNRYHFKVQDSSGNITGPTIATVEGQLQSGELAPNGRVAGILPFAVSRGDRNLTLIYNANCLGCTDSRIRLDEAH